jgi:hypothetical protein
MCRLNSVMVVDLLQLTIVTDRQIWHYIMMTLTRFQRIALYQKHNPQTENSIFAVFVRILSTVLWF